MEKGELQTARKTKQNQGPRQSTPITTGPPHNSRLLVSKAILPVPNRPCHSSLKAGYRSHSYLPGSCFCPPHIWVIPYLTLFCWRSKAVPLHLSSDSKEVVPTKEEVPEHLGSVLTIFSLISRPVLHQAFVKKTKKKNHKNRSNSSQGLCTEKATFQGCSSLPSHNMCKGWAR